MSLLQETLNAIEAEAEKKSAIAIAHADRICALESLVETLRAHGADFVEPCVILCTHYDDVRNRNSVIDRIVTRTADEYKKVLDAIYDAEMCFTTEIGGTYEGRKSIIHRIIGMSAYIECYNYEGGIEAELKRAA
jgi:hypothetical protein